MARRARTIEEIRADVEAAQVELDAKLQRDLTRLEAEDRRAEILDRARSNSQIRRWERRDRRAARRHARWSGRVAPAVSAGVYLLAMGTAVSGQVSTARDTLHWPWWGGVGMAGFVEGFALSMALTARDHRLDGERAFVPRLMTWLAAAFASAVNVYAHRQVPLSAALLGAASLVGITVWEIRSGGPLRRALRARNLMPRTRPKLGAAYVARFPVRAFDAWSAVIADPAIGTRAEMLAAGAARRSRRGPVRWGRWAVWGWWRTEPDRTGGPDTDRQAGPDRTPAEPAPRTGPADQTTRPDQTTRTDQTDRPDRTGPDHPAGPPPHPDRTGPDHNDDTDQPDPVVLDDLPPAVVRLVTVLRPTAEELWLQGGERAISKRALLDAIDRLNTERPASDRIGKSSDHVVRAARVLKLLLRAETSDPEPAGVPR